MQIEPETVEPNGSDGFHKAFHPYALPYGVLNYNGKSNVMFEYKTNEGYFDYLSIWGQPFIFKCATSAKTTTEREDYYFYV